MYCEIEGIEREVNHCSTYNDHNPNKIFKVPCRYVGKEPQKLDINRTLIKIFRFF